MAAGRGGTDSAGRPWAGRRFERNPFTGDDGSAPEALAKAVDRFRDGSGSEAEVVAAFGSSRLLIPLIAVLGSGETGEHGLVVDKSAELSIVTVAGPDGRDVMPVFGSVEAMSRWNREARPVPADGVRVALAAASESTDLVVLDPTSPTEFVIRRPALWAVARSQSWTPSHRDPEVLAEFTRSAESERDVYGVSLAPGDPDCRLAGPELVVELRLRGGLDRAALDGLVDRMQRRWALSELIAARVDSLALRLAAAS